MIETIFRTLRPARRHRHRPPELHRHPQCRWPVCCADREDGSSPRRCRLEGALGASMTPASPDGGARRPPRPHRRRGRPCIARASYEVDQGFFARFAPPDEPPRELLSRRRRTLTVRSRGIVAHRLFSRGAQRPAAREDTYARPRDSTASSPTTRRARLWPADSISLWLGAPKWLSRAVLSATPIQSATPRGEHARGLKFSQLRTARVQPEARFVKGIPLRF